MKLLVADCVSFVMLLRLIAIIFQTSTLYVKKHPSYSRTESTRRRLIDRETSAGVLHSCNKPGCVAAANVFIACRRSTNRFLKNRAPVLRVRFASNFVVVQLYTYTRSIYTVSLRNRDRGDFILMDVPQIHTWHYTRWE